MYIQRDEKVTQFRDYNFQLMVNLNKVYSIELYEKQTLFFYIQNTRPIAWKYETEKDVNAAADKIRQIASVEIV